MTPAGIFSLRLANVDLRRMFKIRRKRIARVFHPGFFVARPDT